MLKGQRGTDLQTCTVAFLFHTDLPFNTCGLFLAHTLQEMQYSTSNAQFDLIRAKIQADVREAASCAEACLSPPPPLLLLVLFLWDPSCPLFIAPRSIYSSLSGKSNSWAALKIADSTLIMWAETLKRGISSPVDCRDVCCSTDSGFSCTSLVKQKKVNHTS